MSERTMHKPETFLWHGDHQALVSEAYRRKVNAESRRDLAKAEKRQPAMTGDVDPLVEYERAVEKAEREYEDALTAAEKNGQKVRVTAIGRGEWRSLVNEHPPREGNKDDASEGWNVDTFPDAAVRAALVEPEFPSNAKRDKWLDEDVTPGEFDEIYQLVLQATLGAPVSPKALTSAPSSSSDGE